MAKPFITESFLFQSETASYLYYKYAAILPIIDYHNHLSPKQLAENQPFQNLTDAWLEGDHYKWRAMRIHGIEEFYITGDAKPEEKFNKWAETVPYTLGNPLFHWTQLELKRYFGIEEQLNPQSAATIYEVASSQLQQTSPQELLLKRNVEILCTTDDDPANNLEYHQRLQQESSLKVFPTFRADRFFLIEDTGYCQYLEKLGRAENQNINNLQDLLSVLQNRINYFHANGCRLSDYGLSQLYAADFTTSQANDILQKKLQKKTITAQEAHVFQSYLQYHLSCFYHEKGWVQQFHLGALRNANTRLYNQLGTDIGCDSVGDFQHAQAMATLFGRLDSAKQLAKTIAYNLNPSQNEVFASMMGNFHEEKVPGKMQWGSAWWFLDQKSGIEQQLEVLSKFGLLSHFIGMLTDSRSLLSFTRHEYFRRILCNLIGNEVEEGLLPEDEELIGTLIQAICYYNAKKYFNF